MTDWWSQRKLKVDRCLVDLSCGCKNVRFRKKDRCRNLYWCEVHGAVKITASRSTFRHVEPPRSALLANVRTPEDEWREIQFEGYLW